MPEPITKGNTPPVATIIGAGTSHDSGLCVIDANNGHPIFAASLERLSRRKNDWSSPLEVMNWADKTLGALITNFHVFPITDDQVFRPENGFHKMEFGDDANHLIYRWTDKEATLAVPPELSCRCIYLLTLSHKRLRRLITADIYLNGTHIGRFSNKARIWSLSLPDRSAITELRIVSSEPIAAPHPDPRTLGVFIKGLVGETSRPNRSLIAGDSLPLIPGLLRYLKKQPVLFRQGTRSNFRTILPRLLHCYGSLLKRGYPSSVHEALAPLPVDTSYDHHLCHAASAYYPGGFENALVVSVDGMGNEYSCRIFRGEDGVLYPVADLYYEQFPVGLNYEIVTALLGFNPMRHAGKVTGLAAYGKVNPECDAALDNFLREVWRRGGRRELYFAHFCGDFGGEERKRVRETTFASYSREDIAHAIQKRTEAEIKNLISPYQQMFPHLKNVCLSGGVFANVRVNQVVHQMGFENIFIQPAMSDAGLAYGAALLKCVDHQGGRLQPYQLQDVFLGPEWSEAEIATAIANNRLDGELVPEPEIGRRIASLIAKRKVVAHFFGRMEFGPRALGNRSILYSAADPDVNRWLNEQLNRTEFMPFAPAVMAEYADRYFEGLEGARHAAEFMTITCDCTQLARKEIPAAVHVDGTARPQLVRHDRNPRFHNILGEYYKLTGTPIVINTSFNMHEEPIVASPEDAIRAYLLGKLDVLVLGNYLIHRQG